MDGHHRHRAVAMLEEGGSFSWTEEQFRVRPVVRHNGVSIRHAEAMKLHKVMNTSTALALRDTSLIYTMNALVI